MSANSPGLGLGGQYVPVSREIPLPDLQDTERFFKQDLGPHSDITSTCCYPSTTPGCCGSLIIKALSCAPLRKIPVVGTYLNNTEHNLRNRFPVLLERYLSALSVSRSVPGVVENAEKALFERIIDLTQSMELSERRRYLEAAFKMIETTVLDNNIVLKQNELHQKYETHMRARLKNSFPSRTSERDLEKFRDRVLKDVYLCTTEALDIAIATALSNRDSIPPPDLEHMVNVALKQCQEKGITDVTAIAQHLEHVRTKAFAEQVEAEATVETVKAKKTEILAKTNRLIHEMYIERHLHTELEAYAKVLSENPNSVGSAEERALIDAIEQVEIELQDIGFGDSFIENARHFINARLGRAQFDHNLHQRVENQRKVRVILEFDEVMIPAINEFIDIYTNNDPELESESIVDAFRDLCYTYKNFMMDTYWPVRNKGIFAEELRERFDTHFIQRLGNVSIDLREEAFEAFEQNLEEVIFNRDFFEELPQDSKEKAKVYKKLVDCGFFSTTENARNVARGLLASRA